MFLTYLWTIPLQWTCLRGDAHTLTHSHTDTHTHILAGSLFDEAGSVRGVPSELEAAKTQNR